MHVNDIRPDLADTQTISTYWMDVAEYQRVENLNPYYLATKYGGFTGRRRSMPRRTPHTRANRPTTCRRR